ncbi:MAG: IS30 family transposase, partial [Clostridia bacterium]|nr:IS30 family transposase [Clostridia bacterium]
VYFADPYCAWQKGTNENLNGLLREFYPKGRNLSRVSPATLKKNLALINARPKKVLHFQKPIDLFELSLKKCCT